jgi:hypothetical protein
MKRKGKNRKSGETAGVHRFCGKMLVDDLSIKRGKGMSNKKNGKTIIIAGGRLRFQ